MGSQDQRDILDSVSPFADEHYTDFYDAHVAKFWKPGHDSDIELMWEVLRSLLSRKERASPINVVDMGTGTGRVIRGILDLAKSKGIKKLDVNFYGIDPGPAMLQRARNMVQADQELAKIAPVEWISSDALGFTTDLPAIRGSTDLMLFAGGGFQHLLSPGEILGFLREVARALRTESPTAIFILVILGESLPSMMANIPNYDADPSTVVSEKNPDITYEKSAVTTTRAGHLHVDQFTLKVRKTSDRTVLNEFKFRFDLTMFDEEAWPGLVAKAGLRITEEKDYAIGRAYFLQKTQI